METLTSVYDFEKKIHDLLEHSNKKVSKRASYLIDMMYGEAVEDFIDED